MNTYWLTGRKDMDVANDSMVCKFVPRKKGNRKKRKDRSSRDMQSTLTVSTLQDSGSSITLEENTATESNQQNSHVTEQGNKVNNTASASTIIVEHVKDADKALKLNELTDACQVTMDTIEEADHIDEAVSRHVAYILESTHSVDTRGVIKQDPAHLTEMKTTVGKYGSSMQQTSDDVMNVTTNVNNVNCPPCRIVIETETGLPNINV